MYQIPPEYYFRIHHVRPRFKDDVESVLMYMSESIVGLPALPEEDFKINLNRYIRLYPGNGSREEKTINNWRTEISALFGLFVTHDGQTSAGLRAEELAKSGDVVQFFKTFLFLFQYPGAHIKPQAVQEQIEKGVHFKPAKYILELFKIAEQRGIPHFRLSKAEVCHCVFNDLRATAGLESPSQTLDRIMANKNSNAQYDESGDVIRYAGDILDYMYIANLLHKFNGEFTLNSSEGLSIAKFTSSNEWFDGYDNMIARKRASLEEINLTTEDWFDYVNKDLGDTDFATDVSSFFNDDDIPEENGESPLRLSFEELVAKLNMDLNEQLSTKKIGDVGEGVVEEHEQHKLKAKGFGDLIHLVKKIPTPLAVGYDIQSFETDGSRNKKYIEVKTTISANPIKVDRVHLTSNEWNTAQTLRTTYYVYRLQITKKKIVLFVVNNPVGLYKEDLIEMTPKDDGADLQLSPKKVGYYEDVVI